MSYIEEISTFCQIRTAKLTWCQRADYHIINNLSTHCQGGWGHNEGEWRDNLASVQQLWKYRH